MTEDLRTSKLAIASLVLGLLGIFVKTVPVLEIICSETFRYQNKKREKPLRGKT